MIKNKKVKLINLYIKNGKEKTNFSLMEDL